MPPSDSTSQRSSDTNELIDPKALIERLGIDALNRNSDDYYKRQPNLDYLLGKPFANGLHTAQLLVRLGLIIENMRLGRGMKILDFGAGTCWIAKSFWQMGCSVVATDVSEEALKLGRRLFEEFPVPAKPPCNWETRLFDGKAIPLADEEADRIVCFDTFHHVPNQKTVIQEFYRVLRYGGCIALNEPLGPHSSTPDSQNEMRKYGVLENDLNMEALRDAFMDAGFESPIFKVAATPEYSLDFEEWLQCREGQAPPSMMDAIKNFQRNSGVFFFQKGPILSDSRQGEGLSHNLSCDDRPRKMTVGKPQPFAVSVRNTGSARWLNQNEQHFGVVHIASRLLDFETRELVIDNSRFRIPEQIEPGEAFEGEIPIAPKKPGRYWLKLDLVAERVCWFESLGSEPIWIEVDVEP